MNCDRRTRPIKQACLTAAADTKTCLGRRGAKLAVGALTVLGLITFVKIFLNELLWIDCRETVDNMITKNKFDCTITPNPHHPVGLSLPNNPNSTSSFELSSLSVFSPNQTRASEKWNCLDGTIECLAVVLANISSATDKYLERERAVDRFIPIAPQLAWIPAIPLIPIFLTYVSYFIAAVCVRRQRSNLNEPFLLDGAENQRQSAFNGGLRPN